MSSPRRTRCGQAVLASHHQHQLPSIVPSTPVMVCSILTMLLVLLPQAQAHIDGGAKKVVISAPSGVLLDCRASHTGYTPLLFVV